MPSPALAVLAGLGQGAGGLPFGMVQGQQLAQHQQMLDQGQQYHQAMLESQQADVPTQMLPEAYRSAAGTAPTQRLKASILGPVLGQAQREQTLQEQGRQHAALGSVLQGLGPEFAPLAAAGSLGSSDKGLELLNNIIKYRQAQREREGGRSMLRGMGFDIPELSSPGAVPAAPPSPAPGPPRIVPTGGEPPQLGSGLEQVTSQPVQPNERQALADVAAKAARVARVQGQPAPPAATAAGATTLGRPGGLLPELTIDPTTGKVSVHLKQPPNQVFTREDIENQLKAEKLVPGTPEWYRAYNNLARIVPMQAGGGTTGAGEIGAGIGAQVAGAAAPPASAAGPPARPPGLTAQRAPLPTAAETTQAADAQTWIKQAHDAATKLETYLNGLSSAGRASYAARLKLQGLPILSSQKGITSPEEQDISSMIGNLQLAWERASGGMRMAASPQMQDRIKQIFGNPSNAATPQHLRTIADMMKQEIEQRAATEQQGGRQPIAVPPGGMPGTPAPGGSPGVQRWGRDTQGRPIRLP